MNQDQIDSLGRTLGKVFGGGVSGAILAHYGFTAVDLQTISGEFTTLVAAAATIYGVWKSHRSNATPPAIK